MTTPLQPYTAITEDGERISFIPSFTPGARQEHDIDLVGHANPGEASGHRPKLVSNGRIRIIMYAPHSAVSSLIPQNLAMHYLQRGWTFEATVKGPVPDVLCGVQQSNGSVCQKKLLTPVERLLHIERYHRDLAPWVLTDAEKRQLRGELGIKGSSEGGSDSAEVEALREQVKTLTDVVASLIAGNNKAVVDYPPAKNATDTVNLTDALTTITTAGGYASTADSSPGSRRRSARLTHRHGAFGHYLDDCARCQTLKARREA